ncbi:hypothetical protein A3B45_03225 [Candidatus Daviesbacteria bacterium RIFCSPLOWO2_01_FULL_39_12]|uniref:Glycosyltransferase RgtA/B/C/D-like domain-containing protein n=1 Tax=Candidatus Daviesbacteria bacterium RIFCSPLOWO2_01_FULL_39_12 TaxID=1797785 RepID=A0A1F5KS66_9BACT|nr:MAG: hypothetical protein A3B45_03225 [Candidatus Daviesbacteria bacterium RIFCSPLOWO2_01_FULL_39_12]
MLFSKIQTHYLLILAITFGNFWIWRIFKDNLVVGILLVILSFLLFKQLVDKFQIHRLLILIFIFLLISFLTLRVGFDANIFITSPQDLSQLNRRHGFYADELGLLFTNRFSQKAYKYLSLPILKLEKNLFSNLDINLYFFASHPRERGTGEFEKYSWLLLFPFILGFFSILKYYKVVGTYLSSAALISMLLNPAYSLGPVLFFPFINVLIAFGLISFLNIFKNKMPKS